jgi:hypothetical protein
MSERYIATNAEAGIPTEGDHGQTLAFLHANHVYPVSPGGDLSGDWQEGRVSVRRVSYEANEIDRLIEHSNLPKVYKLVIWAEGDSTRWLNITAAQLDQIREVLAR